MKYRDALYEVDPITDLRDLMNYSAERYGDNAAYLVKDKLGGPYRPISFREFRSDVTAFGTALMDLDLKGRYIAVTGENRYEWVVAYMAAVCGASVIVPIDRELSAEEIANLLNRSGAAAIVYSGKTEKIVNEALKDAPGVSIKISMDAAANTDEKFSMKSLITHGRKLIEEGRREYFRAEIDPDAMCALIFTSGTTGLAKGVMLSHTNIVHNVVGMAEFMRVIGWTALDVLPMHHTYEFNCGILGTMYQGVTVAFCEGLKYIVKNMAEVKANLILGVPLMFEKMYKAIWRQAENTGKAKNMRRAITLSKAVGGSKLKATKKVFKAVHQAMGGDMRLIIAGGAAIDPAVIEDFNAMGFTMVQGYGMTECSPIVAVNKDRCHKAASAGLPLGKTEVKVIDADADGIGEIAYRGPSVMLGYFDNPEETEKVLKDGWLYSGDYGYVDDDGFVYLTGRKKDVIVTKNGKNIFPEEVEYYLLKSDYIEEAVVWGKDETAGDTVICADIFPNMPDIREKYGNIDETEVRKILDREIDAANEKMPPYKRVKRFDVVDAPFEKTTTQKIKRYKVEHRI
ncbi:MAG: AMP-binding protein [Clostridiales Family XIII bacterium]|jgi:long-chain acyl-CoA synthetase|nr:AMP-binding protein [Clostridiales Family XIII bacterium]